MIARMTVFGVRPRLPWICSIFLKTTFTVITALLLFQNYMLWILDYPRDSFVLLLTVRVDFLQFIVYNVCT